MTEKMGFEKVRMVHFDWHNVPTMFMGIKFKSKLEARWARYLEAIKKLGVIVSWEYEPKRFDCGMMYNKRRFYTPDFRVVEKEGRHKYTIWHEVKSSSSGKDFQKAVSRFRWFKKAYPEELLVLVLPNAPKKENVHMMHARKYVERIAYCRALFKKHGIK